MRKLAIGRILGLTIAVVSFGISIFCGVRAYHENVEFHNWMTARPMETTIDLSKPGIFILPFHQTCGVSFSEMIILDCDVKDEKGNVPDGILEGLLASIVITDHEGKEIASKELTDLDKTSIDGLILLAHIRSFKTGNYTATILIKQGVPALADSPQTIYARYLLTGLEQTPVFKFGFLSIVAGIIGLILIVIVVTGLPRFGIWRNVAQETQAWVKK